MVTPTQDSVCCSRCGCALPGELPAERTTTQHRDAPLPCPATPKRPPILDAWDIDEDLRHIERLLRRDAYQPTMPVWHLDPALMPRENESPPAPPAPPANSWITSFRSGLAWLLLCAGLAATVCGLMLLAWSWFGGRAELLIPGLVAAATGQFGLLGGFLVQPATIAPQPSIGEPAHPAEQWLDMHRRIDEILRADLPDRQR